MMQPGGMQGPGPGQVMVINTNVKREEGFKAQLGNIQAAKGVAGIIRSTLGPKSMLKMVLDAMGGVVLTNDGNGILREIDVQHPAAKSMIELSRTQDEECGDGTTSVIILAGEVMAVAEPLLVKQIHPTVIVAAYKQTLEDMLNMMKDFAVEVDLTKPDQVQAVVSSVIDTKFTSRWGTLITDLAVKAVFTVREKLPNGSQQIDIKRYAKVEKIPGGNLDECEVLNGVMFNKDLTHPKMRKMIKNPRVVLLDCPLEYKKGESQTNVEMTKEEDFHAMLMQEEEEIKRMCDKILELKPDVVITEKGISDLAQHFLMKGNISCIRRVRKMDNNRIAKCCGATIVNRVEELEEKDIGTSCGLLEVKKVGEEYFTYMVDCEDPKACTVILRGSSKDVLNEIERNLADAMLSARNLLLEPKLVPGGGATEMELACRLKDNAKKIDGMKAYAYYAVAEAMEVIPRTLMSNCGVDVVRFMTQLRAKHSEPGVGACMGINGVTGEIVDVKEGKIMDTFNVKSQILKTAVESACMLLRIDQVVSGISHRKGGGGGPPKMPGMEDGMQEGDTVGEKLGD